MLTLSNCISFTRAPLAILFLSDNIFLRISAIVLAMITDSIDGFLARRSHSVSKFGTILDPLMDKFFVYFILSVLFLEQKIKLWQGSAMVSRDFFLCIFGFYLISMNKWKGFELKAVRWGKVTTAMQFVVLIGLTLGYVFSWFVYTTFILFGILAFLELFQTSFNHKEV